MEPDCTVRIEGEDEGTARVQWELRERPGSEPFASGHVAYDLETVGFSWKEGGRPPAEHEFLVRNTIDRAIRGRPSRA